MHPDFKVGAAAGRCKSVGEVKLLTDSVAEFIVYGSITTFARDGNPGMTYNGHSLNSLGLPNRGLKDLLVNGPDAVRLAHSAGKIIILSVAGFTVSQFFELAQTAKSLGFDGVEFNFGCPNVVDSSDRKPIFSFDRPLMVQVLLRTLAEVKGDTDFFVAAKMSPMSNPMDILDTAKDFSTLALDAVVTQNTFPNGLLFNKDGTPEIETPDGTGWAGFAGPSIKPMALGQVSQWRRALDAFGAGHIETWGCGGVQVGQDARDLRRAGAAVVQVGNTYINSIRPAKAFLDLSCS